MSGTVDTNDSFSPLRLVAGFIAAVFTPPVLMVGWGIVFGLDRQQAALVSLVLLPFYLVFSTVAILLIGGPIFWLLFHAKLVNFTAVLFVGIFGGVAVDIFFYAIGWQLDTIGYAFYFAEGVISALVFWWVAIRAAASRAA